MNDKEELQALGIKHGFLDSPTIVAARNKFEEALTAISDDKRIDAGMGFGNFDFWVKLNGVEYMVTVKPPKSDGSKGGK